MKKLFFLFVLAASTLFVQEAKAQIDVTINPLGILFANLSLGADFALSEKTSVEAGLGFGGDKGSIDQFSYKSSNLNVNGVFKYYFNPNRGADKFYADAFLRFVNRSYDYTDATATYNDYKRTRVGVGFGIGYKVVSEGGFVFDIGLGLGRALIDNSSDETNLVEWTKLMGDGKLGIGYRFGGGKK